MKKSMSRQGRRKGKFYRNHFLHISRTLRQLGYSPYGWDGIRQVLAPLCDFDIGQGRKALIAAFSTLSAIPGNTKGIKARIEKASLADRIRAFYQSHEWRKVRYQVLVKWGRKCMCCGREDQPIHVDHIKPLRKHWDRRLDPDNLQVLCDQCNHGKGNWDETDHRPNPRRVRIRPERKRA